MVLARVPARAGPLGGQHLRSDRERVGSRRTRARRASTSSPSRSTTLPHHQLFLGEFGVAEQLIREAETITAATRARSRSRTSPSCSPPGAAIAHATDKLLRAATIEAGTARGEGFAVEIAEWAAAVLHNGLGEYAQATAAAERAYDHDVLGFGVWVLPELIEAAVRSGDRPAAEAAFARLAERSSPSATEWARGIEAAMHALLSDGAEAEAASPRGDRPTEPVPGRRPPRPGEAELRRMAPA